MKQALVIGGGPAGLMAAEQLAGAGCRVCVAEAKPTLGRKFLMAGKSGLNLTRDEAADVFLSRYGASAGRLAPMLHEFGSPQVRSWAESLGQSLFCGSTGRVFPTVMKASPLLRAWIGRLAGAGVGFRTRWRWQGWDRTGAVRIGSPQGLRLLRPDMVVLALGGASWPRLGSDGAWAPWLQARGVQITPFAPANAGLCVRWSAHMQRHFGAPVKGVALRAGSRRSRGEFVISRSGLEGGGIYEISPAVAAGKTPYLDLMPDLSVDRIAARLAGRRGKSTLTNHLRRRLGLSPAKLALLREFAHPLGDIATLAPTIKALAIRHAGLRPLEEAISTAGGIAWGAVDDTLMLTALPGVFVAGEMIDWDAPTGGYLLTACLSTGRWAGRAAARYRA